MHRRSFITSAVAATASLATSALGKISFGLQRGQTAEATTVEAPAHSKPVFTLEEVKSLNAYQRADVGHPFTCCWNSRDRNHLDEEGVLVATERGWICLYCDYTQDWAFDWMKNWRWKERYFPPAPEPPSKTAVSIAVAAAKNCIDVFEKRYPGDDRPRKALHAAEQWLNDPTEENRRIAEERENQVWRANRRGTWCGQAGSAADACGFAARAIRKPIRSVTGAISNERFASGHDWDYVSSWLVRKLNLCELYHQRDLQFRQTSSSAVC